MTSQAVDLLARALVSRPLVLRHREQEPPELAQSAAKVLGLILQEPAAKQPNHLRVLALPRAPQELAWKA